MARIDPDLGWKTVDKHLQGVRQPRHRAVLGCVRDHLKAEAEGDFDLLLQTLAPDPVYRFWVEGSGFGDGPKGRAAVRSHYEVLYEEGRNVCEWDIDRIVVGDDAVVTEGWFDQLFLGKVLATRGVQVDDLQAVYAVRVRLLIIWPCDADARLVGEDSYINGSMFSPDKIRKLSPDEIPDRFRPPA